MHILKTSKKIRKIHT